MVSLLQKDTRDDRSRSNLSIGFNIMKVFTCPVTHSLVCRNESYLLILSFSLVYYEDTVTLL